MRWKDLKNLDKALLNMAKDLGKVALTYYHAKLGVYMSTFHAGYKLAAPIVPVAKKAMGKAMTLARKVGNSWGASGSPEREPQISGLRKQISNALLEGPDHSCGRMGSRTLF